MMEYAYTFVFMELPEPTQYARCFLSKVESAMPQSMHINLQIQHEAIYILKINIIYVLYCYSCQFNNPGPWK